MRAFGRRDCFHPFKAWGVRHSVGLTSSYKLHTHTDVVTMSTVILPLGYLPDDEVLVLGLSLTFGISGLGLRLHYGQTARLLPLLHES